MQITGRQIYDSLMHGALKVIQNKEILNQINIFPIQDGDTGSNLSSLMQTIIKKSEYQVTVKKTLESVAEAALFYLIFIAGLVFFVINPAMEKNSWVFALLVGMLFGFITYSTYDLTNLATLKDWPIKITIIDLIWGSSLGGLVSTVTFFIAKRF